MGESGGPSEVEAILGRLAALEEVVREMTVTLRQLVEAVGGVAANQQASATNQALLIDVFSRFAERVTGAAEAMPLPFPSEEE